MRGLERDVFAEGMPDGAVLVARQRDSPLNDGFGYLALNVKVERGAGQPVRNVRQPLRDDRRAKRGQGVTSLPDDVQNIDAHAGCQPDDQELNG